MDNKLKERKFQGSNTDSPKVGGEGSLEERSAFLRARCVPEAL